MKCNKAFGKGKKAVCVKLHGHTGVHNSTQAGFSRSLPQVEAELAELKERLALKPFIESLKEDIGTLLAYTPFDQWPALCQVAFKNSRSKMPVLAEIYKSRLGDALAKRGEV